MNTKTTLDAGQSVVTTSTSTSTATEEMTAEQLINQVLQNQKPVYSSLEDSYLNMETVKGMRIPLGYRLWHRNPAALAWTNALMSPENLGKTMPGLVWVNDLSSDGLEARFLDGFLMENYGAFVDSEGKDIETDAAQAAQIEATIREQMTEHYAYKRDSRSEATMIQDAKYGEISGYMNVVIGSNDAEGNLVWSRAPGSCPLRPGKTKESLMLAMFGPLGLERRTQVLVTAKWADGDKNSEAGLSKPREVLPFRHI